VTEFLRCSTELERPGTSSVRSRQGAGCPCRKPDPLSMA
jgi:hypothetical protein